VASPSEPERAPPRLNAPPDPGIKPTRMPDRRIADFDVDALYDALDARRRADALSWPQAAREISRLFRDTPARPISASTLSGMRGRATLEGDGVLQMLRWLGCAPERFVPGSDEAPPLPDVPTDRILRFDTRAIHAALDARRMERGLSWGEVAREIPGTSAASLTRMAKGGRAGFPQVARIAAWLGCPIASLARGVSR